MYGIKKLYPSVLLINYGMSNNNIENDLTVGYTFDDVLLIPQDQEFPHEKILIYNLIYLKIFV